VEQTVRFMIVSPLHHNMEQHDSIPADNPDPR